MGMRRAYGCDMPVRLRISPMVTPITVGGVRYRSCREAVAATGLSKDTLTRLLREKRDTARLDPRCRQGQKLVLEVATGRVIAGLNAAGKHVGCSPCKLGQKLKGGGEWLGLKLLDN